MVVEACLSPTEKRKRAADSAEQQQEVRIRKKAKGDKKMLRQVSCACQQPCPAIELPAAMHICMQLQLNADARMLTANMASLSLGML